MSPGAAPALSRTADPGAVAARLNARIAVELDPVRGAERRADLRLAAAVLLAPRVEIAEALLFGAPVPAHRIDASWCHSLGLEGDIVLSHEIAIQIVAHGSVEAR